MPGRVMQSMIPRGGLTAVFSDKAKKVEDYDAEVKDLHAKIGTLAVEKDFLSQGPNGVARQRMFTCLRGDEPA